MNKILCHRVAGGIVSLATLLCCVDAPAREPLRDLAAFEHWVDDNLHCRSDFMEEVQDRKFLDRAKALGVTSKTDWVEGDTPEGDFILPRPILIGGQPMTKIRYWGDSGGEFYAIVTAPADVLARNLRLNPVPERLKKEFDAKTVGATFVGKATGGERLAPALFVRRSDTDGVSEVGCRSFDG